ncbi:hypothetical protein [Mameliella alba]|uniref:DUF3108 domain-containing protein n=1 Tax=Mameliella alba TaxID=561184 RepID=A0A0B3SM28_9RHOB|nr:hypothetical protein [Mameliella alba]KHQ51569.1 hypothetical protein OA50_03731 [Mameliella alba]
MKLLSAICIAAALATAPVQATPVEPGEHYELLFRKGTLEGIGAEATLIYSRAVTNALSPEAAERDTGDIALTLGAQDDPLAQLEFRKQDKHRGLGRFPASVGNPMIMYFYESVIRDMAEAAGGSPYYIRNRVKEALVAPAEVEEGTAMFDGRSVPVRIVRLHPFAEDPNRARMKGFGELEMRVVMSEDVPGWYLSLTAETSGPETDTVYRSEMRFEGVEQ